MHALRRFGLIVVVLAAAPAWARPPALRFRTAWAVQVLARIGIPPARDMLRTLAGGFAEAPITRDARAALTRLNRIGLIVYDDVEKIIQPLLKPPS
jgi:hypothetical protein